MKKQLWLLLSLALVAVLLVVGYFVVLKPILNKQAVSPEEAYYPVSGSLQANTMYFVEGTYTSLGLLPSGSDVSSCFIKTAAEPFFVPAGTTQPDGKTEFFSFASGGYTNVSPLPLDFKAVSTQLYIFGTFEETSGTFVSSLSYYEQKGKVFEAVSGLKSGDDVSDYLVFTRGFVPVDALEKQYSKDKVLLYPSLDRADLQTISVSNEHGTYGFYRNERDTFVLKDFEDVPCDDIRFSALLSAVSFPLAYNKICDFATPEQLAEYGLDTPCASWTIETIHGDSFTVEIGDSAVTQNGFYYVRFSGRDSIYLMSLMQTIYSMDFTSSFNAVVLLEPIEFMVKPMIVSGLSATNYYLIDNLIMLGHGGEEQIFYITNSILADNGLSSSSSVDATTSGLSQLDMQYPAHYQVNTQMFWNGFYPLAAGSVSAKSCLKLGADDSDYEKYGLDSPYRVFYFETLTPVQAGTKTVYLTNERISLYFSEPREDGTYAIVSSLYPEVIATVSVSDFPFIDTTLFDWIDTLVFPYNILSIRKLNVNTPTQSVTFSLDSVAVPYQYYDDYGVLQTDYKFDLQVLTDSGLVFKDSDVANFKQFYLSLLCINLKGQLTLTEEEIQAVLADSSKKALSFSFETIGGTKTTLDFFYYTSAGRRMLVSINGKAEFYISSDDITEIDKSLDQLLRGIKVNPYDPN